MKSNSELEVRTVGFRLLGVGEQVDRTDGAVDQREQLQVVEIVVEGGRIEGHHTIEELGLRPNFVGGDLLRQDRRFL
jgi:hypothetical protein